MIIFCFLQTGDHRPKENLEKWKTIFIVISTALGFVILGLLIGIAFLMGFFSQAGDLLTGPVTWTKANLIC